MTAQSLFAESDSQRDTDPASESRAAFSVGATRDANAPTSLYRKHRPQSFDAEEFVGQEPIVRTLRNAVALGRVAHAYLFSGPRGTGKTTTARLLAKAVNCLHPDPTQRPCNDCANCRAINQNATPDIIEIDAASNRGIDDIRDLRDRVRYAPAQLSSKVYIIDEAHQITGAAANAFLKTLEEPPAHTRFILATTDPEELLPTIVSRCQRFEFRRVGAADIARRLRTVAAIEGIAVSDEALHAIARHATGSLRDALGLLERLSLAASPGPVDADPTEIGVDDVTSALGLSRNERVEHLVEAIGERHAGRALRIVQEAIDEGEDARQLNRQLLSYLRLLLVERAGGPADADDRARALAALFPLAQLAEHARRFGQIDFSIKHAPYPQLPLEIALVEATAAPEAAPRADAAPPELPVRESPGVRQPMSLRERVRGGSSIREASQAPPQPSRQEPAPITPLRPAPTPSESAPRMDAEGSIEVERIADLWPNVRADVKALNRRIEALLSEVDPVAVAGNQITLAVPYPFHRDKLNSDDVRETVAGVLSRLLGREVSLACILRAELAPPGTTAPVAPRVNSATPAAETIADAAEHERIQARVTAAKNIFDAEEIDDDGPAPRQEPSRSG